MFNAEAFLNQTTQNANSTVQKAIPEGLYTAQIKELKARVNSNGSCVMDVLWEIPDANLQEQLKRKVVTTRQSVWLDLTDSGDLDTREGMNVQLGRLRKAVGQNNPGEDWSPNSLIGAVAQIKVVPDVDKTTGDIRDKVAAVAPLE